MTTAEIISDKVVKGGRGANINLDHENFHMKIMEVQE